MFTKKLFAFVNGIVEFRVSATAHYDDLALVDAYDIGREIAHRVTFRVFDNI